MVVFLGWAVFIAGYFIIHKYRESIRKDLFFKTGIYRSFTALICIIVLAPIAIYYLLPDFSISLKNSTIYSVEEALLEHVLWSGDLVSYFRLVGTLIFGNMTMVGLAAATLILITWFFYILKLDVFHKERLSVSALTLVAGMASAFLALLLSDVFTFAFDVGFREEFFNDFFVYSLLKIGMIEELVKLLPVLLVYKFTKEVDEPYDLIYYAAVSALGFAFVENLVYFSSLEDDAIQDRGLIAVFSHIMFSSFAVYGYIVGRYKEGNHLVGYSVFGFVAAALLHAVYDYSIFENLGPLYLLLFIFCAQGWAVIANNAINNSKHFTYSIALQAEKQRFFLALMFGGLMVLNYMVNVLLHGKEAATFEYLMIGSMGILFGFFYLTNLHSLDLVKGYWRPIRLDTPHDTLPSSQKPEEINSHPLQFFTHNFLVAQNIVNYHVKLTAPYYNEWLYNCFAGSDGKVVDRICVTSEKEEHTNADWFLLELKQPLPVDGYHGHLVLVKLKNKMSSLIHEEFIEGHLRLIQSDFLLRGNCIPREKLKAAGFVRLSLVTLPVHINA
jgi:RsiW-degrading membrane proteinase PrsW (M82 family)